MWLKQNLIAIIAIVFSALVSLASFSYSRIGEDAQFKQTVTQLSSKMEVVEGDVIAIRQALLVDEALDAHTIQVLEKTSAIMSKLDTTINKILQKDAVQDVRLSHIERDMKEKTAHGYDTGGT